MVTLNGKTRRRIITIYWRLISNMQDIKGGIMAIKPERVLEMQRELCKIQGVKSAKLVRNGSGEIVECHVLATSKRHPKQISKDVQSVLAASFEYLIDHRIISVAQLDNESIQEIIPRIIYKSVDVVKVGQMLTATVACKLQELDYEGQYTGVATKNGDYRTVAEATLESVRCHLKEDEHIILEGYRVQEVGGLSIANVVLTFVRGKKEHPLVGTAIVSNHVHDAYVRSVFDALNRVLFVN